MSELDVIRPRISGSKKRQRQRRISIAVSDSEYAAVKEKANAAGFTIGSFGRATLLGTPAPRARRTAPVDAQMLGCVGVQLSRAGNNLNQIAKRLNSARVIGAYDIPAAVAEARAAFAAIRALVGRTDRHDSERQST